MLRKITSLSLSLVIILSGVFLSAAPAQGPRATIAALNFSANGPISGTNVRVSLQVRGWMPLHVATVNVFLGDLSTNWVFCNPHNDNPPTDEQRIKMDGYGNYDGTITIASTGLPDNLSGNLWLRLSGIWMPLDSNAIPGITVYNDGLVTGPHAWVPDWPWYEGAHPMVLSVKHSLEGWIGMHHTVQPPCTPPPGSVEDEHMRMLESQIRAAIPEFTVFFITSHGGVWPDPYFCFFEDNWADDPLGPYDNKVTELDVQQAVAKKVSDYEPDWPPYNLVYIQACQSGESLTAPGRWGIGYVDQCYLGFEGSSYKANRYNNHAKYFFADLWQGNTAQHALIEAVDLTGVTNGVLWHDIYTRLHWAYGSSRIF